MQFLKKQLRKIAPVVKFYRKYKKKNKISSLIGMTSIEERFYYENYAERIYEGEGAIVDLGCWFGSTTISLAIGLAKNNKVRKAKPKIYALDQFLWEDWMVPFVKETKWENYFKVNDTFIQAFEENINKYKKHIVTQKVDLTKFKWQAGKIEFLLIDAMKSWDLLNAIQQNFYPYLIPEKSIILHQDFCHYYTYWIHLLTYRLKDFFSPVDATNSGSSVAFLLTKKMPDFVLDHKYVLSDFSEDEVEKAFEYSLSLVDDNAKGAIIAAKIMYYKASNGLEKARKYLDEVKEKGIVHYDISIVDDILKHS